MRNSELLVCLMCECAGKVFPERTPGGDPHILCFMSYGSYVSCLGFRLKFKKNLKKQTSHFLPYCNIKGDGF